jgi:acetyl-CoA synthetase
MDAEDPLFIIYTSGSKEQPRGAVHSTAGYLLHASMTHQYAFNHQEGDVFWCTANIGWITGHTYLLYGPLLNGGTTLMFEGFPTYPCKDRVWDIIDKHQVNTFYSTPTTLRTLMALGKDTFDNHSLDSLKILGAVGEQINTDVWEWYYTSVGQKKCPIIDTWWQTGTGGIMITPIPGVTDLKPGCSGQPFFGVEPALLDKQCKEINGEGEGHLVIKRTWPGQVRTVYADHERYKDSYCKKFPGYYSTGDWAKRDKDGYYWVKGRLGDIIHTSNEQFASVDIENALRQHPDVVEAAVVGYPAHSMEQEVYAFVSLRNNIKPSDELKISVSNHTRKIVGLTATPSKLQWAKKMPKTRSGKILRQALQQIAENRIDDLGDVSLLLDPDAIEGLVENRLNQ